MGARLTYTVGVATNPFEELDHFRSALPLRIDVFDVDYSGEIWRRVRLTVNVSHSDLGVSPRPA